MNTPRIALLFIFTFTVFFRLVSYAQCGSTYTDFGINGVATTQVGPAENAAKAVAVQADGKIVAAGYCMVNNRDIYALVRYNIDGSLDSTFSEDGIIILGFGIYSGKISNVQCQPDGKIVVGGILSDHSIEIIRYNTNGTPDSTFSGDGIITGLYGLWPVDDLFSDMKLQPDGKIVFLANSSTDPFDLGILRFNPDGSFDNTFDGDGRVFTDLPSWYFHPKKLVLQSNGKILVACTGYDNGYQNILIRYNPDGSLDPAFGSGGMVRTDSLDAIYYLNDLVVLNNGKLVVTGKVPLYPYSWLLALRGYNEDGSIDRTFGNNGRVDGWFGDSGACANAAVVMPDQKIAVAGWTQINMRYRFLVASYLPDGTPDNLFDGDGVAISSDSLTSGGLNAIALAPDGSLVAAGTVNYLNFPYQDFAVLRYHTCTVPAAINLPMQLYPNPCENTITLNPGQIIGYATINVYNILGELVLQKTEVVSSPYQLHVEGLPGGIYCVQVIDAEKQKISDLFIKK